MNTQSQRRSIWLWIPLAISLAFLWFSFQPIKGSIGHDWAHAFPRIAIGFFHFWQNFLDIPHYTPSLCAGIPQFADPQSSYYSLYQWLSFFIAPLKAFHFTLLLFYFFGYLGVIKLCRSLLKISEPCAHLAALVFIYNGFSFAHLWVGHLTHHSFLLIPWLIVFWIEAKNGLLKPAIKFNLLFSYIFYSGGLHILYVFAFSALLFFPLLWSSFPKHRKAYIQFIGLTLLLFLFSASGKLLASRLYSAHFYFGEIQQLSEPFWITIPRYFWAWLGATPERLPMGRFWVGIWEYVGFISKLSLPCLFYFVWMQFKHKKVSSFHYSYLLLVTWVLLALGKGGNRFLPILSHYHNPIKLLGSFIPLFVLLVAYCLNPFIKKPAVFMGLAVLLLVEFVINVNVYRENKIGLGYPAPPTNLLQSISFKRLPTVKEVVDRPRSDLQAILKGQTNLACYEPVFGYLKEGFHSEVETGASNKIEDRAFNLNHPGCFLYPEYFNCKPWDPIQASDRLNFDLFVHGKTPNWGVPGWQKLLLWINLLSLVAQLSYLGFFLVKGKAAKVT